jgi:hypothetical protein
MAKKKSKIIQVPVPEDLLYQLDKLSHELGESRSAVIREACVKYVTDLEEAEFDRLYIQSYTDYPEEDEGDWREQLAVEVWGDEDWSEEYSRFLEEKRAKG